jgi:hypothetical protein
MIDGYDLAIDSLAWVLWALSISSTCVYIYPKAQRLTVTSCSHTIETRTSNENICNQHFHLLLCVERTEITSSDPRLVTGRLYPSIRDALFISRCAFHFEMRFSFRDALFDSYGRGKTLYSPPPCGARRKIYLEKMHVLKPLL